MAGLLATTTSRCGLGTAGDEGHPVAVEIPENGAAGPRLDPGDDNQDVG
jgi:hypothetical protein